MRRMIKFCVIYDEKQNIQEHWKENHGMDDAQIVNSGVEMLKYQQMGMLFVAIVLVTTCTFQSAGKAWGAFWLSVSRQGLIFAVVILTASHLAGYTGVLAAQAVSDFLTAVLAILFYRHYFGSQHS